MTSTLMSPQPLESSTWLAPTCLEHLAREQAQLEATLVALQAIRAAILGRDPEALGAAMRQQETIAQGCENLAEHRLAFCERAGHLLDLDPRAITLSALASRLPPDVARQIDGLRVRLRQLATEVEQLNRNNASLLYYSLDFLRRFFDDLTGRPRDGRYGPSGSLHSAPSGSLIDAQG